MLNIGSKKAGRETSVHGNGENCSYFQGQIDEFSKYYHVYAIDTRGHGKTPRGTMPFTIRQFADDLLGFMDKQRIEETSGRRIYSKTRIRERYFLFKKVLTSPVTAY